LEPLKELFILNASATPPYDIAPSEPTELYSQFLAKKSQFKAKELLLYKLSVEEIAFNPNANFVSCLWNCEVLWILPNSPSDVSIVFCPESKSLNDSGLEKERMLSMADKVEQTDIDKLAKQKLTLPSTLMDLFWMTQNFHAIIKLCFGPKSLSASFLNGWVKHMYRYRIVYASMQGSDSAFYAKVFFAIDNALTIHWKSFVDTDDRQEVNDSILLSNGTQDSIISLNFSRSIPKSITERILELEKKPNEKDTDKNEDHGKGNGKFKNKQNEDQKPVYNNNKNHKKWRLQDGKE